MRERAILTLKNNTELKINNILLDSFQVDTTENRSINSVLQCKRIRKLTYIIFRTLEHVDNMIIMIIVSLVLCSVINKLVLLYKQKK